MDFITCLNNTEDLIKKKQFNKAWAEANRCLIGLIKQNDESWYMMYYQMAVIASREKKWKNALFQMGLTIHYLGRLGGATHEKFTLRLLKKFSKQEKLSEYEALAKSSSPEKFSKILDDFLM